jgi:hypothetical protein
MNEDLVENYRIQVYIRREGETVSDGDEFKTEMFQDLEDLEKSITNFYSRVLASLEEELRDSDE